jgi:predicted RND superfamily exporter protein
MLKASIVGLVAWSVRHPGRVIAVALVLTVLSGFYVAHNFKINTDISRLVKANKVWFGLDHAMTRAFP